MKHHQTDQIHELADRGIRQIAITWVNHAGQSLVKVVPLRLLPQAIGMGVGFSPVSDAFCRDGTIDSNHQLAKPDGDLRLKADPTSLAPLEMGSGWAWAAGERWDRNHGAYPADQRLFCRRLTNTMEQSGLTMQTGFELEWMVLSPSLPVEGQAVIPGGPYGADRLIEGLDYATTLLHALDEAEVGWMQFHPEYGPSQFELSFEPRTPLACADQLIRARLVIQRVTRRFGWFCSFSPKPKSTWVGNGGHLHLSVSDHEGPLLQGGGHAHGLRPEGEALIAGILAQLSSLIALACPANVSYQRLVPSTWSAPYQVWGVENREAALRLIPTASDGSAAHLEIKAVDPSANPYLLLGALQAHILEALKRPRPLPPPQRGDPAGTGADGQTIGRLPSDLNAARTAFAGDTVLIDAMGSLLHSSLLDSMTSEIQRADGVPVVQQIDGDRWWPLVGGFPREPG